MFWVESTAVHNPPTIAWRRSPPAMFTPAKVWGVPRCSERMLRSWSNEAANSGTTSDSATAPSAGGNTFQRG